jgi:hypothetical protein
MYSCAITGGELYQHGKEIPVQTRKITISELPDPFRSRNVHPSVLK